VKNEKMINREIMILFNGLIDLTALSLMFFFYYCVIFLSI
jgi:hypothetical protein